MPEEKKKPTYSETLTQGKIGTYKEAPGGGTPLAKGEKAPSKEWVKAHRKMQPRDKEGQFTYNSANAHPLKYGPSRGTTIPPFLIGVKLVYATKKTKGSAIVDDTVYTMPEMSIEEMVEKFREYDDVEGFGKVLEGRARRKPGARSSAEKATLEGDEHPGVIRLEKNSFISKYKKVPRPPREKNPPFRKNGGSGSQPGNEPKKQEPRKQEPKQTESKQGEDGNRPKYNKDVVRGIFDEFK